MKSYEEMTNNVLRRIEEYETEQLHKKAVMKKIAAGLSCICIVAMVAIGVWQISNPNISPTQTDPSLATTGTKYDNNIIVINKTDEQFSNERAKMNFNLHSDDYVPMNKKQIIEYYGIDIFPDVPSDLNESDENSYGIYKRNGSKGEVYFDMTILNYSNGDFSRSVNIEFQTGSLPPSCYAFFEDIKNESVINDEKVKIAQDENGYYYASFMHKNIGFRIIGEGLSQAEFISILSSLIK